MELGFALEYVAAEMKEIKTREEWERCKNLLDDDIRKDFKWFWDDLKDRFTTIASDNIALQQIQRIHHSYNSMYEYLKAAEERFSQAGAAEAVPGSRLPVAGETKETPIDIEREASRGTDLADAIKLAARAAKARGEHIAIGVETNKWLPELQRKTGVIQGLMNDITLEGRLEMWLKAEGVDLDNVHIECDTGDALAGKLLDVQTQFNIPSVNIVALASHDTLENSAEFKKLKGQSFLAAIDPRHVKDEKAGEYNYLRLCEMLTVALEVNFRRDFTQLRQAIVTGSFDGLDRAKVRDLLAGLASAHPELGIDVSMVLNGILVFIPRAEPIDSEKKLRSIYEGQSTALRAA
jgi:hypothetical protein